MLGAIGESPQRGGRCGEQEVTVYNVDGAKVVTGEPSLEEAKRWLQE